MTTKYSHNESIKQSLQDKPELVFNEGLNYLIPKWQEFVDNCDDEDGLLDEWLTDLDCRQIIDDILQMLPITDRSVALADIGPIDKVFLGRTFEIIECVWGSEAEHAGNFDRTRNWYYYRINKAIFASESGHFTRRM